MNRTEEASECADGTARSEQKRRRDMKRAYRRSGGLTILLVAAAIALAGIQLQLILDASAESLHRNFVLEALAVASNGGHGQRLSGSLK